MIERLAVVGVGLIGGSVALAAKQHGVARQVVGVDANAEHLQAALALDVVDEPAAQVPEDCDLIALCVPSDRVVDCLHGLPDVVSFDVSSVKQHVVQQAQDQLPQLPRHFVPCHPIAGSERSGPQAAQPALFEQAMVAITPMPQTEPAAVATVEAFWRGIGAHTAQLTPLEHDEILAATSHLPHLLAFAFMQQMDTDDLAFTGGGFRDFSRIAAANPQLWWRILQLNKTSVLARLEQFETDLAALKQALQNDADEQGVALLAQASALRQQLDGSRS